MSFWTAIVVLFAIACTTWLRAQKHRNQGNVPLNPFQRPEASEHERELELEVEALRQRIAVLERIATEDRRGADLAREIESLRG